MAPNKPSRSTSQTNISPLGNTVPPKGQAQTQRSTAASSSPAPTPTESDTASANDNGNKNGATITNSSPPSSVPDSSVSLRQGPRGTSTQQKSVKPDGADGAGRGTLKEAAMKNVTMLGDPVSLKAEKSDSSPTPEEDGAKGGKLKSKI